MKKKPDKFDEVMIATPKCVACGSRLGVTLYHEPIIKIDGDVVLFWKCDLCGLQFIETMAWNIEANKVCKFYSMPCYADDPPDERDKIAMYLEDLAIYGNMIELVEGMNKFLDRWFDNKKISNCCLHELQFARINLITILETIDNRTAYIHWFLHRNDKT